VLWSGGAGLGFYQAGNLRSAFPRERAFESKQCAIQHTSERLKGPFVTDITVPTAALT